jgi:phage terminase Nu1 subunit (DNA packaging protein)
MLTRTTKDTGKIYFKAIEGMQQFIETLVRLEMMGDSKHVLERTMADADQYLKGEMMAQQYVDNMRQRAKNISGYRSFSHNALQRPLGTEYIYAALLEVPSVMARNYPERYSTQAVDPSELQEVKPQIIR